VNLPRGNFLAGAGFAFDEYRGRPRSDQLDLGLKRRRIGR
jgi:hypothetical protein